MFGFLARLRPVAAAWFWSPLSDSSRQAPRLEEGRRRFIEDDDDDDLISKAAEHFPDDDDASDFDDDDDEEEHSMELVDVNPERVRAIRVAEHTFFVDRYTVDRIAFGYTKTRATNPALGQDTLKQLQEQQTVVVYPENWYVCAHVQSTLMHVVRDAVRVAKFKAHTAIDIDATFLDIFALSDDVVDALLGAQTDGDALPKDGWRLLPTWAWCLYCVVMQKQK